MMWWCGVLISIFCCAVTEAYIEFPKGFKRCKRNDPDLDKCIVEAAEFDYFLMKDGIPSLDLPPVQKIPAPPMRFVMGNEAARLSIVLELSDGHANHTHDKYTRAHVDFGKQILQLDGKLHNITWYGRHETTGRFIVGNIKGQGKFSATLHDVLFVSTSKFSKHVRNGKTYWHIDETRISDRPKKVTFNAENIVANKAVSDAINRIISDNWEAVLSPYYPIIDRTLGIVLKDYINQILDKVSDEELFL